MSTYTPPAEAVEAFKKAWHEADAEGDTGNRTLRGLTAAGPIIAKEEGERVAREIEAAKDSNTFRNAVLDRAARIARGEGS